MRKGICLITGLVWCLGTVLMGNVPLGAAEVIKVGALVPYTGAYSSDGDDMLKGITMGVDEINARGGILGKKIKIIIGDTGELEPDKIVTAVEKLVNRDKVNAIFTGYADTGSDVTAVGKYDIPYFHADTTHISLDLVKENIDKYWNVFMVDDDEGIYGPWVYEAVTKTLGIEFRNKKVAIITNDYSFTKWISDDFRKALKGGGWEIVVDEFVPFGTSEWGSTLGKIRSKDPSWILFIDMMPAEEASFIRQFTEKPINAHVYMMYGPSIPEFLELAGEAANGIFWCTQIAPLVHTEKGKNWAKRFEKKYGRSPGFSTSAFTYDEVYIWAQAVQKVGNEKDYRAVCKAVLDAPYEGICGKYVFDPKDQHAMIADDKIPVHLYQVRNRHHVLTVLGDRVMSPYVTPPWFK
ncbi:MAG: ABC transporter substrate-binding protein [Deltaproteobacteria bacterium]|nr:ABC transporter substrate-binding protein [Deltaproteobacteria bacterium]MBW2123264.1 ABC transporter substrate-binding protein [Deltaproteobacteria bacterium]